MLKLTIKITSKFFYRRRRHEGLADLLSLLLTRFLPEKGGEGRRSLDGARCSCCVCSRRDATLRKREQRREEKSMEKTTAGKRERMRLSGSCWCFCPAASLAGKKRRGGAAGWRGGVKKKNENSLGLGV